MIKKILQKLFKNISYSVFQIFYGKIKKTINFKEDKRIKVKTIQLENKLNYNVYNLPNGRLYTDRIHNSAAILENQLIEGPSIQLKDNNKTSIINNIVLKMGTPRIKRNLKGKTISLLSGGGANDNYWHWMYDVLPRLMLCEKVIDLDTVDFFLLPSIKRNFQNETFKKLNIDPNKMLTSKKFRHIVSEELIITDHPYIFSNDSHKDAQNIPVWICNWLKEKFLSDNFDTKENIPKKIFIDRTDVKTKKHDPRSIKNDKEVKKFLLEKGFTSIKLHEIDFMKQVLYFNNADYIVGLHGGGFANIAFCRPETKIIEFRTKQTGKVIENLANINKLKFDSIIINLNNTDYDKQSGQLNIPTDILEKKINNV